MNTRLHVWAGVECTVRRVGDQWDDQLELSGHARRLDDLDRLAALGIRRLRYPILWERSAPDREGTYDWRWPDERLDRLRQVGISPVIGLLHHGSGPRWTSLIDPDFPTQFARYAGAVAERYPWVDAYIPINEPLTTARFSALYGHWYPHHRDDGSFVRVLLAQIRAIALAMQAIRRVRPDAALVQTEDLGATHATEPLHYQADFENDRRWVTWDLLTGCVDRHHPLWSYLRSSGADARMIEQCRSVPGVVGVNHYLTSERFLDHRLDQYPEQVHGGNGRDQYADVEAVRATDCGRAGIETLLDAAWRRYGIPIVMAEAHIGCTREDQLRWLAEVWRAASACRGRGADVQAVTAWSTFGAFDWASLLTRRDGTYEPGAFDVRSPEPRPTALAAMIRDLARRGVHDHPVLDVAGWWARGQAPLRGRPLALLGADTAIGHELKRACDARGLVRQTLTDASLGEARPWAVVDAGTDDAEAAAAACARHQIPFLTFSSDSVFDGLGFRPYVESDRPTGSITDIARERAIFDRHAHACVIRTGPLFSVEADAEIDDDRASSPTYIPDLVTVSLDLLIDGAVGVWHLANLGATPSLPGGRSYVLASERARLMPTLADALRRRAEATGVPSVLERAYVGA